MNKYLIVNAILALIAVSFTAGAAVVLKLGRRQADGGSRVFNAAELHLLGEVVATAVRSAYEPRGVTARLALRTALAALPMNVYTALDLEKVETSR